MADTFKKDLPIGEEAEKMVLKMVQKKYSQAFKKEGNFKPYDIFVPEKNIAIEVKRDINKQIKANKVNAWKEFFDFWPLSIVVPIMLLSIILGPLYQ